MTLRPCPTCGRLRDGRCSDCDTSTPAAPCIRGCVTRKQHRPGCPVESWAEGAWVTASAIQVAEACNADLLPHVSTNRDPANLRRVTEQLRSRDAVGTDGLAWHECLGCKPRPAQHGQLCTPCHLRLAGWLAVDIGHRMVPQTITVPAEGPRTFDWHTMKPGPAVTHEERVEIRVTEINAEPGSLVGVWQWLTRNLAAGGSSAARQDWQRSAAKTAPIPIVDRIYDQRTLLEEHIARLLAELCTIHSLVGPSWWHQQLKHRTRLTRGGTATGPDAYKYGELPRPTTEHQVADGCRYLSTWLDRVEADDQHPTVDGWQTLQLPAVWWRDTNALIQQTNNTCPWTAETRHCKGVPCPECQRTTLVFHGGDSHVTCTTCHTTQDRTTYDRWTALLSHERKAS